MCNKLTSLEKLDDVTIILEEVIKLVNIKIPVWEPGFGTESKYSVYVKVIDLRWNVKLKRRPKNQILQIYEAIFIDFFIWVIFNDYYRLLFCLCLEKCCKDLVFKHTEYLPLLFEIIKVSFFDDFLCPILKWIVPKQLFSIFSLYFLQWKLFKDNKKCSLLVNAVTAMFGLPPVLWICHP